MARAGIYAGIDALRGMDTTACSEPYRDYALALDYLAPSSIGLNEAGEHELASELYQLGTDLVQVDYHGFVNACEQ